MNTAQNILKRIEVGIVYSMVLLAAGSAMGAALTVEEIQQIETEFGITLSVSDQTNLAAVVKPDTSPAWRTAAETRIATSRQASLNVQVEDSLGNPVEGAQVAVKLENNAFKFGGTFNAKDFDGVTLPGTMTTQQYKDRLLSMFNSVGLNNGFKPKLTGIHTYLPGVLSWAQANDLPVRGHLLMWPGGTHLSTSSTSAYASYDVQGALDIYNASAQGPSDKAALKAVVDAEIQEWAGHWGVYEWDVINETLNNHVLQDILGDDQMAEWFKIAETNKVLADCKLLINEYQIISAMSESRTPGWYTNRRDQYMANIDQVIADGGPLDRIGFQSRIKHERRDPQLIYDRLEEWGNAYSLEMVGTEFEVIDSNPGDWKEYIYTDEERAQITEEMMVQYYSHPLVTGLNAWNTINDDTEALVDYSGNPTLHGLVWYYLHRIRYNTDTNETSDVSGDATVPGAYKGDYEITVTHGGRDYTANVTLASNQTVTVIVDAGTWTNLLSDDFESGWGNWVDGGGDAFLDSNHAIGTQCVRLQDDSGAASATWLNAPLNLLDYVELEIAFTYKAISMETGKDFFMEYSDDGGSTWSTVETFVSGTDFVNNGDREYPVVTIAGTNHNFTANANIRIRCDAQFNGDRIYIDDIVISARSEPVLDTPQSLYEAWLVDYPTIGSTNIEDNLLFYAFGANPTNPVSTGNWPEYQEQVGGINYIHFERNDAEARGLGYTIETTDDLVGGSWVTNGHVFIGSGEFDAAFNAVTNRLPTTDTNGFIRLKVEFTP